MPKYYVYVHAHQEKRQQGFFLYGLVVKYTTTAYLLPVYLDILCGTPFIELSYCLYFCMYDDDDAVVLITAIVQLIYLFRPSRTVKRM